MSQKWRSLITLGLVLVFMITGCGGGGGDGKPPPELIVGPIEGQADPMDEYTVQDLRVQASGDTNIVYQWAVEPATAGNFIGPGQSYTRFQASGVGLNQVVTLKAVVSSDNCDPVVVTKELTIVNSVSTPRLIEIDPEPMSLISKDNVSGDYVFNYWDTLPVINDGDYVVGSELNGYLRRIDSIQITDTQVLASTSFATIDDVVDEGTLTAHAVFGGKSAASERTAEFWDWNGDLEGYAYWDFDPIQLVGITNHILFLDYDENNNAVFVQLDNCELTFTPELEIGLKYNLYTGLEHFITLATGSVNLDMDISASGSWSSDYPPANLSAQELKDQGYEKLLGKFERIAAFPVGPIPCTVDVEFWAGVQFRASVDCLMETGLDYAYTTEMGVEYIYGEWQLISDLGDPLAGLSTHFSGSVEGGLYARAFVRPEIQIKLADVVGPEIKPSVYLRFEAEGDVYFPDPQPCINYGLYAGAEANISVILEILSFKLFNPELPTLYKDEFPIFEGNIPENCRGPWACAQFNPTSQVPGSPVQFDAGCSVDNNGYITKYEWDWNNDGIYDTTGKTASHTWQSDDKYFVQLQVTDNDGKTDMLDEPLEITVDDDPIDPCENDTTPPHDTSINYGCYDRPSGTTEISFQVSGQDNCTDPDDLRFESRNKAPGSSTYSTWQSQYSSSEVVIDGLYDGLWSFEVRAVDESDNAAQPGSTDTCTLCIGDCGDVNEAPTVSIYDCPDTTDSSHTFNWTMSDDQTISSQLDVAVKLDSGNWISLQNSSTGYTWNNISTGNHEFQVRVTDDGNPQLSDTDICNFEGPPPPDWPTVDITNCPGTLDYETSSYTFNWTMSDDQTPSNQLEVEVKLDSGSWTPLPDGSTSYYWSNFNVKNHTFMVKVTDGDGLPDTDTCDFARADIDNNPPTVSITNCPGLPLSYETSSYTFNWTMSDDHTLQDDLAVEVKLDSDPWSSISDGSTSYYWNNFSVGDHTFQVRVTDNGNPQLQGISEPCNFVRGDQDNDPPTVSISNCPGLPLSYETSSYTFNWTMSDDHTLQDDLAVEVKLDSDPWSSISDGSTSYYWSNFSVGDHTFQVRVTDDGNPQLTSTESSCSFERKPEDPNTKPWVDITDCQSTIMNSSYCFHWDMGDAEDDNYELEMWISKDGGAWFKKSGTTQYYCWDPISPGDHTLEVKVKDTGGLWSIIDECDFYRPQGPTVSLDTVPWEPCADNKEINWSMSDPDTPSSQLYVRVKYEGGPGWDYLDQGTTSYDVPISPCLTSITYIKFDIEVSDIFNDWSSSVDTDWVSFGVYDNKPPEIVQVFKKPAQYCNLTTDDLEIGFSKSDDCTHTSQLKVYVSFDGGSYFNYSTGGNYIDPPSTPGQHEVRFYVEDACGTKSNPPELVEYEVFDAPIVEIECPVAPLVWWDPFGHDFPIDITLDNATGPSYVELWISRDDGPWELYGNGYTTNYWWPPTLTIDTHSLRAKVIHPCGFEDIDECIFEAY